MSDKDSIKKDDFFVESIYNKELVKPKIKKDTAEDKFVIAEEVSLEENNTSSEDLDLKKNKVPTECWKCHKNIDEEDPYCKHCGTGQGKYLAFKYTTLGIIAYTFVLGPFSLYLLWKSPKFTQKSKTITTIVILGFFIYITVRVTILVTKTLNAVLQLMGDTNFIN